MASRVQYADTPLGSASTSLTVTLDSTATAGNMLIAAVAIDKSSGTISTPSGWTAVSGVGSHASISLGIFYKVAAGGETGITFSWTSSRDAFGFVGEWEGLSAPIGSDAPTYSDSSVSSASAGPVGPLSAPGGGFMFLAMDTHPFETWDATATNLYESLFFEPDYGGVGLKVFENLSLTQGSSTSTTVTWPEGADQIQCALVVFEADEAAPPTVLGQWCGGVTQTDVSVAYRLSGAAEDTPGRLVVSTSSDLSSPSYSTMGAVTAEGVLRAEVSSLTADTTYYYGVEIDGALLDDGRGTFETMLSAAESFVFAFASCRDSDVDPESFDRIRAKAARFFLQIGDLHYEDIATDSPALYRAAYDEVMGQPKVLALQQAMPVDYVWDDHDTGGDAVSASIGAAQTVYRERVAHYTLPAENGIYHTFTCGRTRVIVLDCRSFRSDFTATDDASKTMLGATQKQWLKDTLAAATEPVIFIVSSVPWNDDHAIDPHDAWGRYQTEQDELIAWATSNDVLDRLYMLSGDAHMLAADDGTNSPGGIPAVQAAPLAQEGNDWKAGTWSEGKLAGSAQYGLITVTDTGGDSITVDYSGRGDDDTEKIALSTVFTVTATEPTTALYLGSSTVDALYLGSSAVDKVYLGSTLVYEAG